MDFFDELNPNLKEEGENEERGKKDDVGSHWGSGSF